MKLKEKKLPNLKSLYTPSMATLNAYSDINPKML